VAVPTDIAGLWGWWKADALTGLTDGDPVTTWSDSSGNGRDATAVGTPSYETGEVNALPAIAFDGVGDGFNLPDASALGAGTMFIVFRIDNDPPLGGESTGMWLFGTDGQASHFPWTDGIIYDAWGTSARKTVGNPVKSLAEWGFYCVRSSAGAWNAHHDGTQLFTTATNTASFSNTPRMGYGLDGVGALGDIWLAGRIAEAFVFDSALSDANKLAMEEYIAAKYFPPKPHYAAAGTGALTATSGAALTPALPAGVAAGDLLIAHVFYGGATAAPSTPAGWTLLDGPRDLTTPGTNGRTWVFGKIAVGGDAAPAFGAQAVTTPRRARVYRFEDVRDDTIANVVGGFAFEASNVATYGDVTVTTPEANCLAVNLVAQADDLPAAGSFTGESGGDWTEAVAEFTGTTGTPDTLMQLQTAEKATAGSILAGSFASGTAINRGITGFYIRGPAPSGTGHTATPADALAITDSVSVVLGRAQAINDPLAMTDTRTFDRGLVQTDAIGVADAVVPVGVYARAIADPIAITDSVLAERITAVAINDALAMSDAQSFDRVFSLADVLGLSDSPTFISALQRALDDALGLTDNNARIVGYGFAHADAIEVTDQLTPVQIISRAIAEALSVTDLTIRELGITRTQVDPLAITDSTSALIILLKQLADTFGMTDAQVIVSTYARTITDVLGVTDVTTPVSTQAHVLNIPDALVIADATSRQMTLEQMIADTFGLTDEMISVSDHALLLDESLLLEDMITKTATFELLLVDELGMTDLVELSVIDIVPSAKKLALRVLEGTMTSLSIHHRVMLLTTKHTIEDIEVEE
jgi:hypothetical protein